MAQRHWILNHWVWYVLHLPKLDMSPKWAPPTLSALILKWFKPDLLQRHHGWNRTSLEFKTDFMYISWLTPLTDRVMDCSFDHKFREEGTGTTSWVTLASYHIAAERKQQCSGSSGWQHRTEWHFITCSRNYVCIIIIIIIIIIGFI